MYNPEKPTRMVVKRHRPKTEILAQIKYEEFAYLISILKDEAKDYHDLDGFNELTLDQLPEWLLTARLKAISNSKEIRKMEVNP